MKQIQKYWTDSFIDNFWRKKSNMKPKLFGKQQGTVWSWNIYTHLIAFHTGVFESTCAMHDGLLCIAFCLSLDQKYQKEIHISRTTGYTKYTGI